MVSGCRLVQPDVLLREEIDMPQRKDEPQEKKQPLAGDKPGKSGSAKPAPEHADDEKDKGRREFGRDG
jgi:hypothetical protein